MSCPNGDPNFNKVLNILTLGNVTPKNRKLIFYGVCIPTRLFIYTLVFFLRNQVWLPYLIALFSLISIFNLSMSVFSTSPQPQWWSKEFQLFIALCILTVSVLVIFKKIPRYWIPLLLFVSLFGGILQSFIVGFC